MIRSLDFLAANGSSDVNVNRHSFHVANKNTTETI